MSKVNLSFHCEKKTERVTRGATKTKTTVAQHKSGLAH